MASIPEVSVAVLLLRDATEDLARQAGSAAETLAAQSARLGQLVQGSRSGMEAVQQIRQAHTSLKDSASRMATLKTAADDVLRDLAN